MTFTHNSTEHQPFAGQQPRRFAFTAAGDETSVAMHLEHHGFGA